MAQQAPENKSILDQAVTHFVAALNALDEARFLAIFRANCVVRDPYGVSLYEGEDGLRMYFHTMHSTWRAFEMRPLRIHYGGRERVVFTWEVTATARNGKQVQFDGVNVMTLEGELIDGLESYWDAVAMFEQIRD